MFTGRTLEGDTIEEMLNPPFRKVDFSDESAMTYVARNLRTAWTYLPSLHPSGDRETIKDYFQLVASIPPSESATSSLSQNPDLETIDTPWRTEVGEMWNHVFVDVMGFLEGMTGFHFHCPKHELVPIRFEDAKEHGGVELTWDIGSLLVDAYRAPGVTVKLEMLKGDEETWAEKDKFDGSTPYDVWFVQPDRKVRIVLEGDEEAVASQGVAVVLARALLCHERHGGDEEIADEGPEVAEEISSAQG